jgi:hypothetical protein
MNGNVGKGFVNPCISHLIAILSEHDFPRCSMCETELAYASCPDRKNLTDLPVEERQAFLEQLAQLQKAYGVFTFDQQVVPLTDLPDEEVRRNLFFRMYGC